MYLRPDSNGTRLLNIDTHILIFAMRGELQAAERNLLAGSQWSISSIVLWELAKLVQLGRLDMNLDDQEVARTLSRLHVWPINLAIARTSTNLDFRGDPADELIAATSVIHDVPLLTRDETIRSSSMVPLAL